ncbi:metallopeptidase TldD-related protein [Streptomyces sp. ICC4]|uniref:TldD/PmbA family protein n=1 Tax=Streptomyces sp. ICC4 TaxID=2099584 RepID=UPI0013A6D007|nr:metallopeptidase TldD-related protein [Streptomyces sp. ICC4]
MTTRPRPPIPRPPRSPLPAADRPFGVDAAATAGIADLLEEVRAATGIRIDLFAERVLGDEFFLLDDAPVREESYRQAGFSVSIRYRGSTGHAAVNSLSREGFLLGLEAPASARAAGVRVPHPERLAAVLHGALAAWDPSYDDPSCGSPSYGGEGDGPARVAVAGAAELLRTARAAALDAARRGGGLDSLSVSYSAVARDFVLLGPGTAHLQGDGQRHLLSCRAIADGTGTGGTGTGGSCTGGSGPGGPSVGYRKAGYRKAGDPGSRESGAWEPGRDALAVGRGAALAAVAKRGAEPVAERNATVVIAAGASGVFAHELLGHPLERDVMAGGLAGVSWREGERVCPVALDVTDDPGIPGAWGSYAYDDEGTAALPGHLVRGGTVAGFVEDAGRLRRQSFRHPPMCRMSNVCIGPGPDDPAALLASVARGYHVSRLGGGEVRADGTFSLGAVDVRRVRDGRPAEPVADAVLTGEVAAVLAGLRGIGSDFAMGSPASCAKYGQEVPVGDGGPTLLVTGVDLGPGVDPWPGPGPRPGPSG